MPIICDWAKEAMLDGIPFRSPRWIMAHANANSVLLAELVVKIILPQSHPRTVASSTVTQDQQLLKAAVSFWGKVIQPLLNAVHCEFCGIIRGPHKNGAEVAGWFKDSKRRCNTDGMRTKIMIKNFFSVQIKLLNSIQET